MVQKTVCEICEARYILPGLDRWAAETWAALLEPPCAWDMAQSTGVEHAVREMDGSMVEVAMAQNWGDGRPWPTSPVSSAEADGRWWHMYCQWVVAIVESVHSPNEGSQANIDGWERPRVTVTRSLATGEGWSKKMSRNMIGGGARAFVACQRMQWSTRQSVATNSLYSLCSRSSSSHYQPIFALLKSISGCSFMNFFRRSCFCCSSLVGFPCRFIS